MSCSSHYPNKESSDTLVP